MSEKEEKEGEEDSRFGHLEFRTLISLFWSLNSKMSNWRAFTKNLLTLRPGKVTWVQYEKTLHRRCVWIEFIFAKIEN